MARRRYQRGSLGFRDGVWIGRWREDVQFADGSVRRRQRQQQLGTRAELPTQRLARRALDALLAEVNAPGYTPRAAIPFWSVVERWERAWLSQCRLSTRTALAPQLAKHVRPTLGALLLSEITPERVEQWVAALPLGPKSKRNVVSAVRQAWAAAQRWGLTNAPFPTVRLPRAPRQPGRSFTDAEVRRIVAAADEPWATLYAFLAETGLRAGEALGLRRSDIDFGQRVVSVTETVIKGRRGPTKNGRGRQLYLTAALAARLDQTAGDGLLWPNRDGAPHRPDKIDRNRLQPLLTALGIPRAGLHAFRHANATELLRRGVPLRTVQARLGHSDPATTLRLYAHVVEADADLAAHTAALAFGGVPDSAPRCAPAVAKRPQVIQFPGVKK